MSTTRTTDEKRFWASVERTARQAKRIPRCKAACTVALLKHRTDWELMR